MVDIGRAQEVLKAALAPLNYRNLDELPRIQGRQHHDRIPDQHICSTGWREAARAGELGRDGSELERDPRDDLGIARRARLVRGAVVVKQRRVRGAGRSRNPDRRLCL